MTADAPLCAICADPQRRVFARGMCARCYGRERRATDLEYRERERQRRLERRATDPEYRERERQRGRQRYATDPEYRERERQRERQRRLELYATDPEYRERERQRGRQRRATDLEYRERRRRRSELWRRAQRAERGTADVLRYHLQMQRFLDMIERLGDDQCANT